MVEIDEDSRLGNEVLLNGKRYGAPDIPADESIAEMYEIAAKELRRLGVHRYEISNFARPGFESRHNLKYWRFGTDLGFWLGPAFFRVALRVCKLGNAAEE